MTAWKLLARVPLRRLLTLPYVALMLALAAVLLGLSMQAGRQTVEALSGQLIHDAVLRTSEAAERQIGGAEAVLDAAFPTGFTAPTDLERELDALRLRFWVATSVHRNPNNYAYYGDRDGRFLGLWRDSEMDAQLRLRTRGEGPRRLFRFSGPNGALGAATVEDKVFEPRERPWYRAAEAAPGERAWSPVYIDFKTRELVTTRTRRIRDARGEWAGVAATDLSLTQLNAFVQRLSLSPHAVALIIEADGQLIAASRGAHLQTLPGGEPGRLLAANSPDPLIRASYAALRAQLAAAGPAAQAASALHTASFEEAGGDTVQLGYARLGEAAGLDWWIAVAVPRDDYLAAVNGNLRRSSLIAVLALLVALATGWGVLSIVTRELRVLGAAARRVGEGVLDRPLRVERDDELGDLARSFVDMQQRLLTDQLTGLSNRTALLRRIEDRVLQQRRRGDAQPFAVMFADFNNFKAINDRFGHAVGDEVLREMAQLLRQAVRAGDLVARYAGDEFVIMLESVGSRADAEAARQHLEAALRRPLLALQGRDPKANEGASIGMAVFPEDGQDSEALLNAADLDMYARKRSEPDADTPHPR